MKLSFGGWKWAGFPSFKIKRVFTDASIYKSHIEILNSLSDRVVGRSLSLAGKENVIYTVMPNESEHLYCIARFGTRMQVCGNMMIA